MTLKNRLLCAKLWEIFCLCLSFKFKYHLRYELPIAFLYLFVASTFIISQKRKEKYWSLQADNLLSKFRYSFGFGMIRR